MMLGLETRNVSAWMLGAAAAAALWSTPANTDAQQAPAAAVQSETAVQQELRRLYAESGREMPEIPANVQAQSAASVPAPGGTGARPVIVAPAPATPPRPNPLMSFIKKIVPGSQSTAPAPAATPHPAANPPVLNNAASAQPQPQRFAPQVSQPPRRLTNVEAAPALPQQAAAAPPKPAQLPPAAQPTTKSAAAPAVRATTPIAVAQPRVATASQNTPNAPMAGATQRSAADEFPDPFTEMSEDEADEEELEEQDEAASPFTELMIDEPATAPQTDSVPKLNLPGIISTTPAAPVTPIPPESNPTRPQPAGPQLPAPMIAPPGNAVTAPSDDTDAKMDRIRDRGGMKGLKGFCPVTLRDERELKDALPEFQSSFRGQKFHLSSADAKAKFDADPSRYAPAAYGADIVVLVRDKDVAEGTLEYAAWFKGRLFLFASEETSAEFLANPTKYAPLAGLE